MDPARRCLAGLQHPPLRQRAGESGAALSRRGGPRAGDHRQRRSALGRAVPPPAAGAHVQRIAVRLVHRRVLPVQRAGVGRGPAAAQGGVRGTEAAR